MDTFYHRLRRTDHAREADVLKACKRLLRYLQSQHKLQYWRIDTAGKIVRSPNREGFRFGKTDMVGFSDLLLLVRNGPVVFVECKAGRGTLSQGQHRFKMRVESMGHLYWMVKSADDLEEKLKALGVSVGGTTPSAIRS